MVHGRIKGAGVTGSLFLPRMSPGTRLIQMYMERNVDMCIVHVVLRAFPAYACVIEYCIYGRTDIHSSKISAHNARERLCFLF